MMAIKKKTLIYALQHNPTGRIYVGRTQDLESRIKAHLTALKGGKHHNELMQEDYNKSGDDYSLFVLDEFDGSPYPDVRDSEQGWMDKLNTGDTRIGYNYKDPHFKQGGITMPEIEPGVPIPNEVNE